MSSVQPLIASVLVVAAACASSGERSPSSLRAEYADFDGVRVAYDDVGQGPEALVFVHGWAGDAQVWRNQVPALKGVARLIAVDLPGHGRSEKPEIHYTMDFMADAIAAVLDDAGVERAVLAGHSNGTPVIRQFYRRHPSRTEGLIVVDGALQAFFTPEQAAEFAAPLEDEGYLEYASDLIAGMLQTMDEALAEDVKSRMLETPAHVMASTVIEGNAAHLYTDETIDVPLIAIMANAPFWTEDYVAYVRELAPGCDYVVLDDVGHFLMLERPGRFNELVTEFVEGVWRTKQN